MQGVCYDNADRRRRYKRGGITIPKDKLVVGRGEDFKKVEVPLIKIKVR